MSSSATSGAARPRRGQHLVAAVDLGDDLDVVLEREQASRARRAPSPGPRRSARGSCARRSGTARRAAGSRPRAGRRPRACRARAAPRSRRPSRPLPPWSSPRRRGRRRRSRARALARSARMRISQWRAPAVADDVRRALAHRPGEHGVDLGRQRRRRVGELAARCRPRSSAARAPGELVGERRARGSRLTASRTSASASRGDVLDLVQLARRARRVAVEQPRRASSLLSAITDRLWPSRSCRSRAMRSRSSATASVASSSRGLAQLAVDADDAAERDHQRPDRDDGQHRRRDRAVVVAAAPHPGCPTPSAGRGDHRGRDAGRQQQARGGGHVDEQRGERRRRARREQRDRDHRQQRERADDGGRGRAGRASPPAAGATGRRDEERQAEREPDPQCPVRERLVARGPTSGPTRKSTPSATPSRMRVLSCVGRVRELLARAVACPDRRGWR